jgi:phosphoribosyl 1,2-cyclic phosphodiesterase
VATVPVPHDAAAPVAFVVSFDGCSLGHATDLGHLSRPLVEAFRSCNAVLLESNYDAGMLRDGPYPWSLKERILSPLGHLSNGDVARFLQADLGDACETVVLAHLSQKNNHPEVALMAAETAIRRRGVGGPRLGMTGPDGTGWIAVSRPADGQLRLF